MTVKELYNLLGEDYAEVQSRLDNDEWIAKYLKKFCEGDYIIVMNRAVSEADWKEASKMARNIKGMALNLGLNKLARISNECIESLNGNAPVMEIQQSVKILNEEYERVLEEISKL